MTRSVAYRLLFTAALGGAPLVTGCVVILPVPSAESVVEASAAPSARPVPPSVRRLRARLGEVEAALERGRDSAELRAERLALTVALARLSRAPAADVSDKELLARASADIELARERLREVDHAPERDPGDDVDLPDAELAEAKPSPIAPAEDSTGTGYGAGTGERVRLRRIEREKRRDGERDKSDAVESPPPGQGAVLGGKNTGPLRPKGGFDSGKVGAARVEHVESPQGVMIEVRRHFGRVLACLPAGAAEQGVRLRVEVRVDESGVFRSPRALGEDLDPRTAACVEDVFRIIRVDAQSGSRLITVPLWLRPSR